MQGAAGIAGWLARLYGTSPLHLAFDNSIGTASVQPPSFPDGMLVDWARAWSQWAAARFPDS